METLKQCLRRTPPIGLKSVELTETPAFAKKMGHLTKIQKQGLALERVIVKRLSRQTTCPILNSVWMRFHDRDGSHLACADIVVPEMLIGIEVKRTYTREADAQLLLLYLPLLSRIWPGSWKLVVMCKFWDGPVKPLIDHPFQASVGLNYCI